jgi:DNA polymerase-3 subunit epsilon
MKNYAAIDLETTGFGKSDRIVEIGIVVFDGDSGARLDEFETLINPERDIGNTETHGISASMVESAPLFRDIISTLSRLLDGNVLVAHNLRFDQRFLAKELERVLVQWDPGAGICTYELSRERLDRACERFNIPVSNHHRALADARAVAAIFKSLCGTYQGEPVQLKHELPLQAPRTLRRESVGGNKMPISLSQLPVRYPAVEEVEASYLHALDVYIDDLILTSSEEGHLDELASMFDIDPQRRGRLHDAYIAAAISAARRDGIVSAAEGSLIEKLCSALNASTSLIPSTTSTPKISSLDNQRVCFTGTFVVNGSPITKEELAIIAANSGLQPIESVTKFGCDMVVAADPASTSGKAKKARNWGIPVVGVEEFLSLLGN